MKNARGDMLARFLGFGVGTEGENPVWASASASVPAARPSSSPLGGGSKRSRRTPVLVRDRTLPEFEFDRRVAYWAMTRTDPPTATFRLPLYESHLRGMLDTNGDIEAVLHELRTTDQHISNKTSGLRGFLVDIVVGVIRGTGRVRGLRTALILASFEQDVHHAILGVQNNVIQYMVARIGVDRIVAIALRAIRDVSQEQTLAAQLKSTAQMIRKLEDLLAKGQLMDEDIYELKLRRDLFLNALRLYVRLTKAAVPL